MTENETHLIQIIREHDDPAEALQIALTIIIYFLQELEC